MCTHTHTHTHTHTGTHTHKRRHTQRHTRGHAQTHTRTHTHTHTHAHTHTHTHTWTHTHHTHIHTYMDTHIHTHVSCGMTCQGYKLEMQPQGPYHTTRWRRGQWAASCNRVWLTWNLSSGKLTWPSIASYFVWKGVFSCIIANNKTDFGDKSSPIT